MHLPRQGEGPGASAARPAQPDTVSAHSPSVETKGMSEKAGLPLANPLNILISSSPVAENTASKYFKDGFVKVTAEGKKKGKEQFPAPHCSSRNKGKLGGWGGVVP